MHYQFPRIEHIDQVREAIAGRDEFVIAERDGYSVANYMVHLPDSFPEVQSDLDAIRRECRGIIFGPDGRVISRRYHKFFNVNEKPETQMDRVDLSRPHVILEKLDGSMITPVRINGVIRWCTKMGVTDFSEQVERFVAANPQYVEFAEEMEFHRLTPIFEWCSRQNRIVIDHPEDRLVLTGIRHNFAGDYFEYPDLCDEASNFNIEVVNTIGRASDLSKLLEDTRALKDAEGYIIRFDDGAMLKIKGEWYCQLHSTKDILSREKDVVELIVTEKMDDTKAFMTAEDRAKVEDFEVRFYNALAQYTDNFYFLYADVKSKAKTRKDFALGIAKSLDPFHVSMIFKLWDNPEGPKGADRLVRDLVAKNVGTGPKFEVVKRKIFPNVTWSYYNNDGDN